MQLRPVTEWDICSLYEKLCAGFVINVSICHVYFESLGFLSMKLYSLVIASLNKAKQ